MTQTAAAAAVAVSAGSAAALRSVGDSAAARGRRCALSRECAGLQGCTGDALSFTQLQCQCEYTGDARMAAGMERSESLTRSAGGEGDGIASAGDSRG